MIIARHRAVDLARHRSTAAGRDDDLLPEKTPLWRRSSH
jgi:hypothetical protein